MIRLNHSKNKKGKGLGGLSDAFVLFTEDREITFWFRSREGQPCKVSKTGPSDKIESEYLSQKRARDLLGDCVPEILSFETEGDLARLTQEYLPERFLGNIVAAGFFRKERIFVSEAARLFFFYENIFLKILSVNVLSVLRLDKDHFSDWVKKLRSLDDREVTTEAFAALQDLQGADLPCVFQHGDFCPRNILYAGGGRKVLIDWEDAGDGHLALEDFSLLLITLKELYASLFKKPAENFIVNKYTKNLISSLQERLRRRLEIDDAVFQRLYLASLVSLCCRNIDKGRTKTARGVFKEIIKLNQTGKII